MNLRHCKLAVIAAGAVISGCTQTQEPKSEDALKPINERPVAKKSTPKPKPHQAPIEPYALTPYTRSQYPKTFAKYGTRMAEVEAYRRKAAEAAARNPQCQKVTTAEISSFRGSINNMHFWVDCNDGGKRFNFTERELDANVAAVTQSEKAFSKATALSLCEELIKRSVNYPSTLGINRWDVGYKKFEPLGNVKVAMNFKAKNAFNLELKYKAICTFEPGNPNGEIVIKERTS